MASAQQFREKPSANKKAICAPEARRFTFLALAILFATATVLYTVAWIYYIQTQAPPAQLGIDADYSRYSLVITKIAHDSPADRAGMKVGDRIVAVNGRELKTQNPFYNAVSRGQPGDRVSFRIERGQNAFVEVSAILEPRIETPRQFKGAQRFAAQLINYYQIPFAIVALAVLFLRRDSLHAWLLSLLFAGCIAGSPLQSMVPAIHPALRGFMLAYMLAFYGLFPAFFYWFFATFPIPSPLDRRAAWLKFALLITGGSLALPAALWAGITASLDPVIAVVRALPRAVVGIWGYGYALAGFGLGLVSLVWNLLATRDATARRKMRVVVWGNLIGFGPLFLLVLGASIWDRSPWSLSFWLWGIPVLLLGLMPASFAYAVVKHRVLEIPVLLRRSARYLLVQRGFVSILLVLAIAATLSLASWFSRTYPGQARMALPVGTGFGILLVVSGTQLHGRVRQRLDRAFFRSAYDARVVLEDLAARTRTITTREELEKLLRAHLEHALHPEFIALYLASSDGYMRTLRSELPPLSDDSDFLRELCGRPEVRDVEHLPDFPVVGLRPECAVPIMGSDQEQLQGLILLGPRLSEEPYSREDKRLLLSVAMQASAVLRSIALAETIADRMETDRRVAQEIEIARQVQRKLLPQRLPQLRTLDYAGECRQARAVGGDYYDFLDLGEGKVGLVLADVAGKGMSAALLMANLQANLRSQSALAVRDLPELLQSVNRLFFENTEENRYATAFVGVYEDQSRKMTYINCGHNPPLVLRADDSIQRLESTATVLGLFPDVRCLVAEVQLGKGDLLILYTDGVIEAATSEGEEFGDTRMLASLREYRMLAAKDVVEQLVRTVVAFSPTEQGDDITVVVAKGV